MAQFNHTTDENERRMSMKAYDYYRFSGYSAQDAVELASTGQETPELYEQKAAMDNANSGEYTHTIGLIEKKADETMNEQVQDKYLEWQAEVDTTQTAVAVITNEMEADSDATSVEITKLLILKKLADTRLMNGWSMEAEQALKDAIGDKIAEIMNSVKKEIQKCNHD